MPLLLRNTKAVKHREANMRWISIAAILLFTLASSVPALSQSRRAIAADPRTLDPPLEADAPRANELIGRAQASGLVRVIARVAQTPGMLTGAASDTDLVSASSRLMESARGVGAATVQPIVGFPLTVIELNADQLRRLIAAGLISDIIEDVPVPTTLQDSIPLINADDAAKLGATGAGQTIAILDTGVAAAHPFFGGRVVAEACFSSNSVATGATTVCPGGVTSSTAAGSAAPCANAGCNHGTHVAGIAAGNDGKRRGTAPQANIIAIQVFSLFTDSPGGPQTCANAMRPSPCILTFTSDQIRGLQRVFDLRNTFSIASVNMSLGGGNFATCDTDSRKALVDQLRTARIATVISSGNGSSSTGVGAPGCISTAITVGNTTKTDTVAASSDSAPVLDLLAPGTNITSSVPGGGFAVMSGTSMAAPHVAGAVAALRSRRPDLTVDQIENALESTGVPITDPRNKLVRPRINLEAALQAVITPAWSGAIWRYTNVPCSGEACPGWQRLDNNPATVSIATGNDLYQMHFNGSIWRHTGTPCTGDSCPGWVRLDNNPMGIAIAADGENLYQLHRNGTIWRHTGTPCSGDACPGWVRLDNNPMGVAIVAGGAKLYQLHRDGSIWEHTGTPCSGDACPG